MRSVSYLPRRSCRLTLVVLTVACLAVLMVALPVITQAKLGDVAKPAKPAASFGFDAWKFDRGNGKVFCNPIIFGDYRDRHQEMVVGEGGELPWFIEYDINFPVDAEYTLQVRYASPEPLPIDVWVDGRKVGEACARTTGNPPPYWHRHPRHTRPKYGVKHGLEWVRGCKFKVKKGKHTLKFTRDAQPPHLRSVRIDSPKAFPKGWKQRARKVDVSRMLPRDRISFLPPDAVNIAAQRVAIKDTIKTYGPKYAKGPEYLKRLAELEARQKAVESGTPEQKQKLEDDLRSLRSEAMLSHPLLDFKFLLFYRQESGDSSIYLTHTIKGDARGNICSLSLADGKVTELAPELGPGRCGRYDLSFDATKIVFCFAKAGERYRIYEIDIDPSTGLRAPGNSFRQITFPDKVKSKSIVSYENTDKLTKGYEDIDPVYLPNGKIMFCSTRSERSVLCFPATVTTLHLMDADGGNIRCISQGQVNEISPCVFDDGRVVYMRWEYIDKGFANAQSLWSVHPDGSMNDHVYKNLLVSPGAMIHARSIPDSPRFVTIGAGHHGGHHGPVILVDNRRNRRNADGMVNITPEINYPAMGQMGNNGGRFKSPYPLSEKLFLVSHKPGGTKLKRGAEYGVYVLDEWGNRAELYRAPDRSCHQPVPLRPRPRPTVIPSVVDDTVPAAKQEHKLATMFLQDVYQGMPGIKRGKVKYVRVMEPMNLTWDQAACTEGCGLQAAAVSMGADVAIKKVHGIATVHEDGSAFFTVPAEKNVFFQALDENFMELQRMKTFINLMSGEQRSCVGCHEVRRKAPALRGSIPMALAYPVEALRPQPGDTGPRAVHYETDVQPILDKYCIKCHSGEKPKGDLVLTGAPTGLWNVSYQNLLKKKLVSFLEGGFGSANVPAEPPMTFGSHQSKLVDRIRQGPCNADLKREEFIRIVTWIDANVPYYGTHKGKKNAQHKEAPDFRPVPLVGK